MARRPPLGQHFLRDEATLRAILAAAAIRPGERVLEVGPGPGVLTAPLAAAVGAGGAAGRVVAVEADEALADALRGRLPNLEVVHADALRVDLAALGPFDAIVANLPYQISGPVTMVFLDLLKTSPAGPSDSAAAVPPSARAHWSRAVLMYQKEFADRMRAGPGSKAYGRLSVHVARFCAVARVRDVPPGAFDPPPQVDSQVLRLAPHPTPPFEVADEALWRAVVDGAFQHRRKTLRNALPPAVAPLGLPAGGVVAALEARGWAQARAEELAPADFARLCDDLRGVA